MRSGYTLPVFATASAIAALRCLQQANTNEHKLVVTERHIRVN